MEAHQKEVSMDINEYCAGNPARVKALAAACDVTMATVYNWSSGRSHPYPRMWQTIVRASGGAITIESLLFSFGGFDGAKDQPQ